MFVDTFTVQYIRKLRKNNEDDENEPKRITPFISIFAGIVLLICSAILIVAKSNFIQKSGIKMPNVTMKVPNVKLPDVKMPHVKFPHVKFPAVPHIHFNAQRQQVRTGPPTDPIIAGEYSVRRLYNLQDVFCPDGEMVSLWQDGGADGKETLFGSSHGKNVVGSLSTDAMWKKGNSFFALARYNGNERGIVTINENTQVVDKINPGDGCLFELKCVSLDGTWERMSGGCDATLEFKQKNCVATGGAMAAAHVSGNSVTKKSDGSEMGYVVATNGRLEFYDTTRGCAFRKTVSVNARE